MIRDRAREAGGIPQPDVNTGVREVFKGPGGWIGSARERPCRTVLCFLCPHSGRSFGGQCQACLRAFAIAGSDLASASATLQLLIDPGEPFSYFSRSPCCCMSRRRSPPFDHLGTALQFRIQRAPGFPLEVSEGAATHEKPAPSGAEARAVDGDELAAHRLPA